MVAERFAETAVRAREAERDLLGEVFSGCGSDSERLVAVWAVQYWEWRRVSLLMGGSGWDVYRPEPDVQGCEWARERGERGQRVLSGHAAELARRQDGLRAELWLSAGSGRLVRKSATRAGMEPVEVLAQLAERIVVGEDGTVSVPPFSPATTV
ncbi:hypothetical protein [Streptomyces sp. NPDC058193]|uniref:hypothetical protein n=1 Tax=Streptomyces sp. NPDC058193 TaxID=3346373 RepID=UPI0036E1857A